KDDGDAWDIKPKDYFNRRSSKALLVSSECFTEGPTAYALQNYRIGESTISQKVMIYEGSKKIEFITKVEWKETKRMLRTSFPVNIKSDIAKYNIQFGHIERPATHENKIDKARYETSGHKWVDLSEKDYGVALLNNCKYGYRIWDNVLDMNLLRSPMYPGIDADKGIHEFTYVLYPHIGDLEHSDTYLEAYRLNVPLWIVKQETSVHDSLLPPEQSLIQIDSKQVIIENIKKSEDDQGYILRLYNSGSEISRANISFQHFKPESIVDLMENKLEQCESETNLNYSFKPFEILSVKLLAASQA
ncbi:MAG TPA: glycoside hydrolase family 38 C-terminal domain-containing protein, partial [Mobilitalea sp.]|nr:glycoside hydrolase family 38 C-terminal domain-containing protein [Mobilitalea sp.]